MSYSILQGVLAVQVLNQGEWGTFYLRQGSRKDQDNRPIYFADLTIHSSFGNVAYHWSHMGSPAHEFLDSIDKDYFLGKLYGQQSHIFDFDKTVKAMKRQICDQRKGHNLGHGEARQIWNGLVLVDDTSTAEHFMQSAMDDVEFDNDKRAFLDWLDPGGAPWCQSLNPQATGLWEKLWPEFIEAIKAEATGAQLQSNG